MASKAPAVPGATGLYHEPNPLAIRLWNNGILDMFVNFDNYRVLFYIRGAKLRFLSELTFLKI